MGLLVSGALIAHSRADDAAKERAPVGVVLLATIAYLAVAEPG